DQILGAAQQCGYDGVEWRGYRDEMELPRASIFTTGQRGETRRRFQEAGLEFTCLASSVRLADLSPVAQQREREAFTAYAELARFLRCPLVRGFGGNLSSGVERAAVLPAMGAVRRELGEIASRDGVTAVRETHDA